MRNRQSALAVTFLAGTAIIFAVGGVIAINPRLGFAIVIFGPPIVMILASCRVDCDR